MPSRSPPVTCRSRYRASSGVAWASNPASSSSLRPCEPVPSALAICRSVFTTVTTVSTAARSVPSLANTAGRSAAVSASSSSAVCPRSPISRTRAATTSGAVPVAVPTARMASFSASPRSTPANSGAISPWPR